MDERVKQSDGEEELLQRGVHKDAPALIEAIQGLAHRAGVRELKLIVQFAQNLVK